MADVSPHMRDSQRLLDHPTGRRVEVDGMGLDLEFIILLPGGGVFRFAGPFPVSCGQWGAHPSSHGRDGSGAGRGSRVRPASLRTARDSHRGVHGASRIAWWHHHVTVRRLLIGLRPVPTGIVCSFSGVFKVAVLGGTIEGVSLFSRKPSAP